MTERKPLFQVGGDFDEFPATDTLPASNVPLATTSVSGALSAADKTKLDGIAAGAIDASLHATLRTLEHWMSDGPLEGYSGAYMETLPSGSVFPTQYVWWVDSSKAAKLMDETVTYNSNYTVASVRSRMYASDGTTVALTLTDTMTYTGVFETSRTRVIT